jgi:hypothetical protein
VSSRSTNVLRLLLAALVVAWFFSPPQWRYAVPLWLPFLLALGLEVEFAIGGWLRAGRSRPRTLNLPRRTPQPADLERFGWQGEEPEEDDPAFWSSKAVPPARSSWWRRLAVSAVVLAFVGLAAWGISIRRGWDSLDGATQARVERALSRQATRIAGHHAEVHCDTAGKHVGAVQEADGLAQVGGTEAWVTPSICFRLYRVLDHRDSSLYGQTGRAIAVLAHESWHLHGVIGEGLANCYAFQSGVEVGTKLGLSTSRAYALMRSQLADNATDSAGSPAYVVPAGCRDGGPYDLHPHSSRFP